MKIKMLEYFQGTNQPTLSEGQEYESADIGQPLCDWLLEHSKAVDVTPKTDEPKAETETEPAEKKPTPRKRAPRKQVTDEGD